MAARPLLHQHDVGGLEIPVDDALPVGGGKRLRDPDANLQRV